MHLMNRERGSGKTTKLIYTSEVTGYPIVVRDRRMVDIINEQAAQMGCIIPKCISVDELRNMRHKPEQILIDEGVTIINDALQEYLQSDVVAITFTSNDYYAQLY